MSSYESMSTNYNIGPLRFKIQDSIVPTWSRPSLYQVKSSMLMINATAHIFLSVLSVKYKLFRCHCPQLLGVTRPAGMGLYFLHIGITTISHEIRTEPFGEMLVRPQGVSRLPGGTRCISDFSRESSVTPRPLHGTPHSPPSSSIVV